MSSNRDIDRIKYLNTNPRSKFLNISIFSLIGDDLTPFFGPVFKLVSKPFVY